MVPTVHDYVEGQSIQLENLHAQNPMFENGMNARHARIHFRSPEHRILYMFKSNAKYRKYLFVCFNL